MAPKIKMIYFDMKGRAEPTRLALAIGGIEFEDERITREAFQAAKAAGAYPFGQLPVLEVDGRMIAQSQAMLRYAGQLAGLYPSDPYQALLVDEMVGAIEDVITAIVPSIREQDEGKRLKMREDLAATTYPKLFALIDKRLGENDPEGTGYSANGQLSIADLIAYSTLTWIASGMLDGIPATILDDFPKIKAVLAKVGEHPKVAAWNEAHAK